MASLNDTIESYLRNGSTPDDIVKAINDAKRKIAAEKSEKEQKEAIAKARENVHKAMVDYLTVLTGEKPTPAEVAALRKDLEHGMAEIEAYAKKKVFPKDLTATSDSYVRVEKNGKRDKDSEKIIRDYLDELFKKF